MSIVNFEHICHLFLSVSVVDFEQVNVCRVTLNCETKLEKIMTSVPMSDKCP